MSDHPDTSIDATELSSVAITLFRATERLDINQWMKTDSPQVFAFLLGKGFLYLEKHDPSHGDLALMSKYVLRLFNSNGIELAQYAELDRGGRARPRTLRDLYELVISKTFVDPPVVDLPVDDSATTDTPDPIEAEFIQYKEKLRLMFQKIASGVDGLLEMLEQPLPNRPSVKEDNAR